MLGIGADEQRAQTLGVNTRWVKVAGFALTAAVAGAVGAAMSVRWTYIDPHTVFNPFIGFQTVLIALIGGAATLWGPLIAAIVFSVLAETLRLQVPQIYMMSLGLLLILSVLYLPGGLASLRAETFRGWRDGAKAWWIETRDDLSGGEATQGTRQTTPGAPRCVLKAACPSTSSGIHRGLRERPQEPFDPSTGSGHAGSARTRAFARRVKEAA
jgi:hypothetical protein